MEYAINQSVVFAMGFRIVVLIDSCQSNVWLLRDSLFWQAAIRDAMPEATVTAFECKRCSCILVILLKFKFTISIANRIKWNRKT